MQIWPQNTEIERSSVNHIVDMINIVMFTIEASLSSRQLLLLRLSLPLSDKIKQLHGDCISYNKATTIWLLPVADNSVTKT